MLKTRHPKCLPFLFIYTLLSACASTPEAGTRYSHSHLGEGTHGQIAYARQNMPRTYDAYGHEYLSPTVGGDHPIAPREYGMHGHYSLDGYLYYHRHGRPSSPPTHTRAPQSTTNGQRMTNVRRLSPIRTPDELLKDLGMGYTAKSKGYHKQSQTYDELIRNTAETYGIDPILVKAVMHVESAFDPNARSHKGARGLMQLMPQTARRYGVRDINDPRQNIQAAVLYLRDLMRQFNQNTRLVLAAYNAGEGAVRRYQGVPPFGETQDYIRRVLQYYRYYSKR